MKSIGFMCKSNNGIVNYLLNRNYFLLVFVDGFALQGRSVKAPETYELFKSIGNIYKNHTSRFQVLGAYFIFYWFPLVIIIKMFPKSLKSLPNHQIPLPAQNSHPAQ